MTVRRLVENLTLDRQGKRRRSLRRMWSYDELPMPRAWFAGPKWKRHCHVGEVLLADVLPEAAQYHRPGRELLVFTFEDEVRERVLKEIRPGVVPMWSDPSEGL